MTYKPPELSISVIRVKQNIGEFYIGKARASDVIKICHAPVRRKILSDELDQYIGIQRELNEARVKELVKFVKTSDAAFPNSIILSVNKEYYRFDKDKICIQLSENSCNIIDGQHRLAGFEPGYDEDFELILTLFPDLSLEYQSYIFSIINTRSTKINPSLAQDLYSFSQIETPEKLSHWMARVFSKTKGSPWFQMIKILGRSDVETAILSQSSFCRAIVDLISSREDSYTIRDKLKANRNDRKALLEMYDSSRVNRYPLWVKYCKGEDKYIYDLLKAFFVAAKTVFPDDWGNPKSILTKTTGYNALMLVLKRILQVELPEDNGAGKFSELLNRAKLSSEVKKLTSRNYNPGGQGEGRLKSDLLKAMDYAE